MSAGVKMATNKYRITLVNEELRGSGKPNIVYMGFASDADAVTFGANLGAPGPAQPLTAGLLTSVDNELSTNYALPYPNGTEVSGRVAFGNAAGERLEVSWSNVPAGFNANTRVPALLAAGLLMVNPDGTVGSAPSYGNVTIFDLSASI